jgi:hypothetical protein
MQTRVLEKSDLKQIEELIKSWRREMTVPVGVEAKDVFFRNLTHYLDKNHPSFLIGSFVEEELVCVLGVLPWSKMPYVTISDIISSHKHSPFRLSPLTECTRFMLQYCKDNKRRAIYSVMSCYQYDRFNSYWKRFCPEFYHLDHFSDGIIKKNTKPEYAVHWKMMGEKKWPVDLVVICRRFEESAFEVDSAQRK